MADVWDTELAALAAERGTTVKVQRRPFTTKDTLGGFKDAYADRAGLTAVAAIVESLHAAKAGEVSQRAGVRINTMMMLPIELDDGTDVDIDPARDRLVGVTPAAGAHAIAGKVYTFPQTDSQSAGALVHPVGSVSPTGEGQHVEALCLEIR